MQNRYTGDVGDYVKLALLRALQPGHKLGVAWWLFPDEAHNGNGRHIGYLTQPEKWRGLDPDLFDELERIVSSGVRQILALQTPAILRDAIFFDQLLPVAEIARHREAARQRWFNQMRDVLSGCDLIFVDPDNGLEPARYSHGTKDAGKSICLSELRDLHRPARTLVVYHHQSRFKGGHEAEIRFWQDRLRKNGFLRADAIRADRISSRVFFLLNASAGLAERAETFARRHERFFTWFSDQTI